MPRLMLIAFYWFDFKIYLAKIRVGQNIGKTTDNGAVAGQGSWIKANWQPTYLEGEKKYSMHLFTTN